MDGIRKDLPVTDEELTQFVLAGRKFFSLSEIEKRNWYYAYYATTIHIAKNLHLIKHAEYHEYTTILIEMRGTNEVVQLNRFDQSDRFLFREVAENLLLETFRRDIYRDLSKS